MMKKTNKSHVNHFNVNFLPQFKLKQKMLQTNVTRARMLKKNRCSNIPTTFLFHPRSFAHIRYMSIVKQLFDIIKSHRRWERLSRTVHTDDLDLHSLSVCKIRHLTRSYIWEFSMSARFSKKIKKQQHICEKKNKSSWAYHRKKTTVSWDKIRVSLLTRFPWVARAKLGPAWFSSEALEDSVCRDVFLC